MAEEMVDNLVQEITRLISNVTGKDIEELTPDTHFWEDLEIDSIKALEIVVAIEKRFKVRVREEQIPRISNINQAVTVVEEALKKRK